MSTGLHRVYFREDGTKNKWTFEAGFVHLEDAKGWVGLEKSYDEHDLFRYKIMYNGKNVFEV